jgi:tripartite-type tricarboxylate transporter receptor subunit TctC
MSRSSRVAAGAALLACWLALPVLAQAYPSRPVRMIVPFPAGGVADVLGRMTAQRLSAQYGQQVVVENRGGSGGHVGAELAAKFFASEIVKWNRVIKAAGIRAD